MSHIAVERNRRRQMNEHLKVLRSLTPCFYIKRGDQASIIGGVIEFIKEMHQVLESLESKKRRKSLSPNPNSSTSCPISPRPPMSPYIQQHQPLALLQSPHQIKNPNFGIVSNLENNNIINNKELGASCNSPTADVEAKISGSNVVLKIISQRARGQMANIVSVLERLSFEVLHLNVTSMEDTVLYSFLIKIGLECQLSMEELVLEVQQSIRTSDNPQITE